MSEDTQRQTAKSAKDDDGDVAAQTHPRGCSCHQVAARRRARERRDRREGVIAIGYLVEAHESVKDDWTEHHDRPEDVRDEVWLDPLFTPTDPTEPEQRFLQTRRIRRRNLRWKRGGSA